MGGRKTYCSGSKNKSEENPIMFAVRKFYYNLMKKLPILNRLKILPGLGFMIKNLSRFCVLLKIRIHIFAG